MWFVNYETLENHNHDHVGSLARKAKRIGQLPARRHPRDLHNALAKNMKAAIRLANVRNRELVSFLRVSKWQVGDE